MNRSGLALIFCLFAAFLQTGCEPPAPEAKQPPLIEHLSVSPDARLAAYVYDGGLYLQAVHTPDVRKDFEKLVRREIPGEALAPAKEENRHSPIPPETSKRALVAKVPCGPVSWSAAGDRLYYTHEQNGNWDIWFYEPAKNTRVRLTSHPGRDWAPRYVRTLVGNAPDAIGLWQNSLYFFSDRDGTSSLWALNLDIKNSKPVKVLPISKDVAFTSDGRGVAAVQSGPPLLGVVESPQKTLFYWRDKVEQARIPIGLARTRKVEFIDKGRIIAVLGSSSLQVCRLGSKQEEYPVEDLGEASAFAASPDGDTFILVTEAGLIALTRDQKRDQWSRKKPIFAFTPDTIRLAQPKIGSICFLPDGRRLAFVLNYSGPYRPVTKCNFILLDIISGRAESFCEEGPDASIIAGYYMSTGDQELATRTLEDAAASEALYFPEVMARIRSLLWRAYIIRDEIQEAGKLAERFKMYKELGDTEFYFRKNPAAALKSYEKLRAEGQLDIPELTLLQNKAVAENRSLIKRYALAQGLLLKGNYKKAVPALHGVAKLAWKVHRPLAAKCLVLAGETAEKAGDPESALSFYNIVPEIPPWHKRSLEAGLRILSADPARNASELIAKYRQLVESAYDYGQRLRYSESLARLYFTQGVNAYKASLIINTLLEKIRADDAPSEETASLIRILDFGGYHRKATEVFTGLCRQTILLQLSGKPVRLAPGPMMFESAAYLPWDAVLTHNPEKLPSWFCRRLSAYARTLSPEIYNEEMLLIDTLMQKRTLPEWHRAVKAYLAAAKKSTMYRSISALTVYYLGSAYYRKKNWAGLFELLELADSALGEDAVGDPGVFYRLLKNNPDEFQQWMGVFFGTDSPQEQKPAEETLRAWQKLSLLFRTDLTRTGRHVVPLRREYLFKFVLEHPKTALLDEALYQLAINSLRQDGRSAENQTLAKRAFSKIVKEFPDSRRFLGALRRLIAIYRSDGRVFAAYNLMNALLPVQKSRLHRIVMRLYLIDFCRNELAHIGVAKEINESLIKELFDSKADDLRQKLSPWEWSRAEKILGIAGKKQNKHN